MLVDSHCHLNYLDDADASLAAARAAGVHGFLCIGVNAETHDAVVRIAERHADVWASAGMHPENATGSASLEWVTEAARHARVVGIGEIGLDYFKVDSDDVRRHQRDSFAAHLAPSRAKCRTIDYSSRRTVHGSRRFRIGARPTNRRS